jgi:hypothetical protein
MRTIYFNTSYKNRKRVPIKKYAKDFLLVDPNRRKEKEQLKARTNRYSKTRKEIKLLS